MDTIIDLRGVTAADVPILYFWSRWWVNSNNFLEVQISFEDPSVMNNAGFCRSIQNDQCYEHNLGWSPWTTVWEEAWDSRTYTWQRQQVDLSQYAQSGSTPGKRIRIRFVSDSLRNGGDDGWYIDDVQIKLYSPDVWQISRTILVQSLQITLVICKTGYQKVYGIESRVIQRLRWRTSNIGFISLELLLLGYELLSDW